MYETPIVEFASADDELFYTEFKKEGVIHPEYMAPQEWLPNSKTVISFFIPFTEEVKASNRCKVDEPYAPGVQQNCSAEWLHARIEGQAFLNKITDYIIRICTFVGNAMPSFFIALLLLFALIFLVCAGSSFWGGPARSRHANDPSDEFLIHTQRTEYPVGTEKITVRVTNRGGYAGEINQPYLETEQAGAWYIV